MEGCVRFVCIVWILEIVGIVFHDAFEEVEIIKVNGAAKADRDVNPNIQGSAGSLLV